MAANTRGLANLTLVTKHFGDAASLERSHVLLQRPVTPSVPNYSRPASMRTTSYVHPRNDRGGVGRSSVGSDSTPPDMVADEDGEDPASGDEDHQYHLHQSRLFDSFWQEGPFENMPYPALLESPSTPRRPENENNAPAPKADDTPDPEGAQLNHVDSAWPLRGKSVSNAKAPPRYSLFPRETPSISSRPGSSRSSARPPLAPRSSSLSHHPSSQAPLLPPIASTSTLYLPLFSSSESPSPVNGNRLVPSPPPISPLNRQGQIWDTTYRPYGSASYSMPTTPQDAGPQHFRNHSLQLPETQLPYPLTRGRSATCVPSYNPQISAPTQPNMVVSAGPSSGISSTISSSAPSPLATNFRFSHQRPSPLPNVKLTAAEVPTDAVSPTNPIITGINTTTKSSRSNSKAKAPPRKTQIVSTSWIFPSVQDEFPTIPVAEAVDSNAPVTSRLTEKALPPPPPNGGSLTIAPLARPSRRPAAPQRKTSVVSTSFMFPEQQDHPRSFFEHESDDENDGANGGSPSRKSRLKQMVRGLHHRRSQSDISKQQLRKDEADDRLSRARAATAVSARAAALQQQINDADLEVMGGSAGQSMLRRQRSEVFSFLLKGRRMH
ncbi:uncharacterized protein PpBr36_09423 [Pyricularia pennisetigena]|uniref:uncharacterized protein n=1 Tax=Pyricularia pennisetigena TaxID=1578925 RepID=UPI0011549ED2|nr:uncharacterized protein PpBr36_09423 [Pyricularia pennisetigena]TLS21805.1 hypothetical protein PpBr36_09423 [Pyricularia pennisetigena]